MCTGIGSIVRESQVDLTSEFDATARTAALITELFFWKGQTLSWPTFSVLWCFVEPVLCMHTELHTVHINVSFGGKFVAYV